LAHTLAASDKPLKSSEFVSYLLAGLNSEYDPLVTSITTRVDPLSIEELYGYLLTYEQRINQHHTASDLSLSSVNVAHKQSSFQPRHQRAPSYKLGVVAGVVAVALISSPSPIPIGPPVRFVSNQDILPRNATLVLIMHTRLNSLLLLHTLLALTLSPIPTGIMTQDPPTT